jgi:hypothetical protein
VRGAAAYRLTRLSLLLAGALALAACASAPPEPESVRDPGVDFSSYHTWAFGPVRSAPGADEPVTLLGRDIRNAISAEMRRRGYTQSQDAPDLQIYYETASSDKVESNPVRVGVGVGSWGSNVGGSVNMSSPSVRNYREGTLVVHAVDAKRNAEVWQGRISSRISKGSLETAAVQQAVAAAMRDFPSR